jgi:hypothetical protein
VWKLAHFLVVYLEILLQSVKTCSCFGSVFGDTLTKCKKVMGAFFLRDTQWVYAGYHT